MFSLGLTILLKISDEEELDMAIAAREEHQSRLDQTSCSTVKLHDYPLVVRSSSSVAIVDSSGYKICKSSRWVNAGNRVKLFQSLFMHYLHVLGIFEGHGLML
ncbi:hypothetical protein ACOSQ2_029532 [Xanthoceras sorbifolium]